MKSLASWVITGAVCLLAVGGVALAFSGNAQFGFDACNNCTLNAAPGSQEEMLGAGSPNRIPNGYMDTAYGYYVDGIPVITETGTVSTTVASAITLTEGGLINSTSTIGTVVPLGASDFDTENVIDVMLNVSDATLSFPASSTLTSFLPVAGQTRTLFIRNATTTASIDLLITGGTGVLLKVASSSPATLVGDTDGANYGVVRLIRKANTDIEALLTLFKDAT